VTVDIDAATFGDPPNDADNDNAPTGNFDVAYVALPFTSGTDFNAVVPFENVTLPVTGLAAVTVAVIVTGCPATLAGASTDNSVVEPTGLAAIAGCTATTVSAVATNTTATRRSRRAPPRRDDGIGRAPS
jgi:hypothetical protein